MDFLALFDPDTVMTWVRSGGYVVIFGLLFACGLGLPLPEDIPLMIGGFFVGKGSMNLIAVSVCCWCGIIGGDCVLYYLARKYGLNITRVPFIGTHVTKERILKAEKLFERWGVWIVAIGRLFAGIRGAMVIAAGATRFNFIKFIIADGLAALVSGGMFIAVGYWGGRKFGNKSIGQIRQEMKPYEHWIILGIIVAVVLAGLYLWYRARKHKTPSQAVLDRVVEPTGEGSPQRRGDR